VIEFREAGRVVILDDNFGDRLPRRQTEGHVHTRDVLIPRVLDKLHDNSGRTFVFDELAEAGAVNLEP
jgi:hypothetical protein